MRAGRFALIINGVEAIIPRPFTQEEIDAGFVEFIVSDQQSGSSSNNPMFTEGMNPDPSAPFSNMVDGALIELFMKYDNVFGVGDDPNSVYPEQYMTRTYNGMVDQTLLEFIAPLPITPVLVGFAIAPPTSVTFAFVAMTDAANPDRFEISGATGDNTDLQPTGILSSSQSQGLAIQIANSTDYFRLWYENRATSTDTLVDYPTNAAEWDSSVITFGSGETNIEGNRIQQQGADWSARAGAGGTLVLNRSGAPEINFPPSVQAALSTVIQASQEALASELDARRVTRSNIGNLGLLAPVLDEGNAVLPVTPPSGG